MILVYICPRFTSHCFVFRFIILRNEGGFFTTAHMNLIHASLIAVSHMLYISRVAYHVCHIVKNLMCKPENILLKII